MSAIDAIPGDWRDLYVLAGCGRPRRFIARWAPQLAEGECRSVKYEEIPHRYRLAHEKVAARARSGGLKISDRPDRVHVVGRGTPEAIAVLFSYDEAA